MFRSSRSAAKVAVDVVTTFELLTLSGKHSVPNLPDHDVITVLQNLKMYLTKKINKVTGSGWMYSAMLERTSIAHIQCGSPPSFFVSEFCYYFVLRIRQMACTADYADHHVRIMQMHDLQRD